jgi:hypothetical protein
MQDLASRAGIPYKSHTTWDAGLAFTWKQFTLDLRYYDTDLSNGESPEGMEPEETKPQQKKPTKELEGKTSAENGPEEKDSPEGKRSEETGRKKIARQGTGGRRRYWSPSVLNSGDPATYVGRKGEIYSATMRPSPFG